MSARSARAPCRKWTICSVRGGRSAARRDPPRSARRLDQTCPYVAAVRAAAFLFSDSAETRASERACVRACVRSLRLERSVPGCHCGSHGSASRRRVRVGPLFIFARNPRAGRGASADVRAHKPACPGAACGRRSRTTGAPFCSSCLQSGCRGARNGVRGCTQSSARGRAARASSAGRPCSNYVSGPQIRAAIGWN